MPQWPLAKTCVNCDAYPEAKPTAVGYDATSTPDVTLVASDMRCDGQNGQWLATSKNTCAGTDFACAIRVMNSGASEIDVTLADAAVLVAADTRCSKIFYTQDGPVPENGPRSVYCLVISVFSFLRSCIVKG